MRLIGAILGFLLFLLGIGFAFANKQNVTVSLWPFGVEMTAPLYIVTLGALILGVLFGGLFVWIGMLPHRFKARRLGKDMAILSDKMVEMERELETHRIRPSPPPSLLARPKWRFWERN